MNKATSIRRRIFLLTMIVAATAILLFAILGTGALFGFWAVIRHNNEEQNATISDIMSKTTQGQAQEMFTREIIAAANLTDKELWTVIHDSSMLAQEAATVLKSEGRYTEIEIEPPKAENAGKLALQLEFASYADPNDEQGLTKVRKLANLATIMESILQGSESVHDIVISVPEGITLAMDDYSQTKLGKDGQVLFYDAKRRPFYAGAVTKHGLYIGPLNDDNYDKSRQITVGVPAYDGDELLAIVGSSVNVTTIGRIAAESKLGENMNTCMISDLGSIIYSDNESGELGIRYGDIHNLFDSANEELVEVAESVLEGESGCRLIRLDGEETYLAYAPIQTLGWGQFFFVPKETLDSTAVRLIRETDQVFNETQQELATMAGIGMVIAVVVSFGLLLVVAVVTRVMANRVSKPIIALNEAGMNFIEREKESLTPAPMYFGQVKVETHDELEELWYTLMDMEINIAVSMQRISKMASDKERIAAELSLAASIQADMLPMDFVPSEEWKDVISLYGSMTPAKEVGGDFYDFFMVDRTHLALVMADVSGKGVPAAMFMMMAKIFINSFTMPGVSPKDALARVNNAICAYNKEDMFITVWLGILDLETGTIVAANAAHEFPVVRGRDGQFKMFDDPHGFVIGGFEGMDYEEYTIQLEKGDTIFVYTDGVPEARTADDVMYGEERMVEALNETAEDASVEEILEHVHNSVNSFVGGGDQFDDLTMLGLRYNG